MSARILAATATVDPLAWAKLRVPDMVPSKFAAFHRDLTVWPAPGEKQARVVFRGAAKSTLTKAMVVWACQHKRARGVLIIRAIASDAKADREALLRIAAMAGLPAVNDSDRGLTLINGVPVWTRTPGGAVRGLHHVTLTGEVIRPDTIIIDDLETRETARSKMQTDNLATWLAADALQTAGRGVENAARVIMLGTPITPTCLVSQAMRRTGMFESWLPPLVVPYTDGEGVPAWPELYEPDLAASVPAIVMANEYDLNPLPPGSLVFDPAHTQWVETPDRCPVVVAVDPAGDGEDRTGIVAAALTPTGLHIVDALAYDGPAQNMPETVGRFVRQIAESHDVLMVGVEAVGGFVFALPLIRQACQPFTVKAETPHTSKLERALNLTLWHTASKLSMSPHLVGSDLDVEAHTWTLAGHTITGHDDMPDAMVWACALATRAWTATIPT